jgi:predicted DNA binding protein
MSLRSSSTRSTNGPADDCAAIVLTDCLPRENVRRLLARLRQDGYSVEILRKTPFDSCIASLPTLTTDALFSGITEKQMDALLTAYAQGYFRYPRGADLQTIASRQKMGRTTFLEHLKKAENKLITALIPHIELYRHVPQDRRRTMGFARDAG